MLPKVNNFLIHDFDAGLSDKHKAISVQLYPPNYANYEGIHIQNNPCTSFHECNQPASNVNTSIYINTKWDNSKSHDYSLNFNEDEISRVLIELKGMTSDTISQECIDNIYKDVCNIFTSAAVKTGITKVSKVRKQGIYYNDSTIGKIVSVKGLISLGLIMSVLRNGKSIIELKIFLKKYIVPQKHHAGSKQNLKSTKNLSKKPKNLIMTIFTQNSEHSSHQTQKSTGILSTSLVNQQQKLISLSGRYFSILKIWEMTQLIKRWKKIMIPEQYIILSITILISVFLITKSVMLLES